MRDPSSCRQRTPRSDTARPITLPRTLTPKALPMHLVPTLMKPSLEEIQAENEALRQEVATLKQQIAALFSMFVDQPSVRGNAYMEREPLSPHVRILLKRLPNPFTVEDLIQSSEEMDVNVFLVYADIQILQQLHLIETQDDLFWKTDLLTTLIEHV